MKVLIACESSQTACIEFRKLGHEAFSCDLEDCTGGHPEWHIKGDVLEQLDKGWDMMIAHPPCTHLAVSGAMHFKKKIADGRQQSGINLFLAIANAPIPKICIENPVGIMSRIYRKPDQIIQPYRFGHAAQKTTCLWLKGLDKLKGTHHESPLFNETIDKGEFYEYVSKKGVKKRVPMWHHIAFITTKGTGRQAVRKFVYPLISKAMAQQWGS